MCFKVSHEHMGRPGYETRLGCLCPYYCFEFDAQLIHFIVKMNSFLKVTQMPLTKRVTPHQSSGRSLSVGVGLDDLKLQFPPLPQEWKDRYVPGQMYKYQAALPKLPVPPLQQTLEKYITSIKVLNHYY